MPFHAETARILADLESVSRFGRVGPTAVTRLAFTSEDNAAHRHLEALIRREGLETYYDAFGNFFGRRPGLDAGAAAVMAGSHLDGPPKGGLYDGTAGVLCALEAVRLLNAAGVQTRRPIEVAALRCEHLDRFGLSCLGSRAMAGKLTVEDLHRLGDTDGISLAEAIRTAGHRPEDLDSARRQGRLHAFVELHVEQGRVLEDLGKHLGVVTCIAGPTRFRIRLTGLADHSGGTPMSLRRDALCGAAEIILELERMAQAADGCVATVGIINVRPGAVHTIPGEAEIFVDIRGVEARTKRALVAQFREFVGECTQRRGLEVSVACSVDEDPVPVSPRVVDALCQTLTKLGTDFVQMPSGGGHDTQHMAACTDAGMLFIPSHRGISHTPEEYTSPEDLALGASVLADCLLNLADSTW